MTTYELKVRNLNTPSFEKIRRIAYNQLTEKVTRQEIDEIYYQLERGTVVIGREELLWCYLYSFGNKHQAKIHAALN